MILKDFSTGGLFQRALFQKLFKMDLHLTNFGYFLTLNFCKINADILKYLCNLAHAQLQWICNNHHSSDPPLFFETGKEVNFDYLPQRGEGNLKNKKKGEYMVQGQVFLKGGGLTLFLFNFFKVYHFYI